MSYDINIVEVAARPLLVARGRANESNVGEQCHRILDLVWNYVRANGIDTTGISIMVYHDEPGKKLFFTEEGLPMEGGAEVKSPVAGEGEVVASATPAGRAAHTTHIGPYEQLGLAHGAVQRWCQEHGYAPEGQAWEVYGHMTEDPAKQTTEVFYLLA